MVPGPRTADPVAQWRAENEQLWQQPTGIQLLLRVPLQTVTVPFQDTHTCKPERLLYIPTERTCPVFQASVRIGISERIDEICAVSEQDLDQAYFICDHLEGEAKNETIQYNTDHERGSWKHCEHSPSTVWVSQSNVVL